MLGMADRPRRRIGFATPPLGRHRGAEDLAALVAAFEAWATNRLGSDPRRPSVSDSDPRRAGAADVDLGVAQLLPTGDIARSTCSNTPGEPSFGSDASLRARVRFVACSSSTR